MGKYFIKSPDGKSYTSLVETSEHALGVATKKYAKLYNKNDVTSSEVWDHMKAEGYSVEEVFKETEPSKEEISRVMSAFGKKGASLGGKARAASLTREERKKIAQEMANKRWALEPLPCPFCGSTSLQIDDKFGWLVQCNNCGGMSGEGKDKRDVIKKWNGIG